MARMVMAALCALLLGGASAGNQVYLVDSSASSLSARVGFLGLGSKQAGFPQVSGTVRLDSSRPQDIAIDVVIDARALDAPDKVTRRRLKGEKFFWVEKYPEVRFEGRKLELQTPASGHVDGELTARGITRPVRLEISFDRPVAEIEAGEAITLTGKTRIDRYAFGMRSYRLVVGKWVNIELRARMVPRQHSGA